MNPIEEIKARLDIVDLVSESVQLRRAGKNFTGFCPFHANSRTPAFVVFPDTGTWRCFGQCNEGGDIFRYVMKKEGMDFPQALRHLAERAGVVLQAPDPQEQEAAEEHERLRTLLEEAVTFYRSALAHTRAGQAALAYLRKRGLTDSTIETFGLGYAPDEWEAALTYFKSKGYTEEELLQAGLATQRESGGAYDRFRNRITIPIRDANGKMTGFGARVLDPNDQPKFLNSPQTALFDKGHLLYGLDAARKAIRTQDQVVIVEGYLDVIALHQAGFANTVSPMGTALTEHQLRMLKRYTRRIVLALDPDAAGQRATLRGLEIARQTMDHGAELAFDARGLLRHEARLSADLRVTTLPDGQDPDEVALRDPQAWAAIVDAARPVVVHVMETLAAGQNLDDPKVKSQVAGRVMPLIEDIANPVERDAYRQRLARLLKIDERALMGSQPTRPNLPRRRPRRNEPQGAPSPPGPAEAGGLPVSGPGRRLETLCLQDLLRTPNLIHSINRALQEAGLNRLDTPDFQSSDHQALLSLVQQAVEQIETEPAEYVLSHVEGPLQERAQTLLSQAAAPPEDTEKLLGELTRNVLLLRQAQIAERLNQIRFLQEEALQEGNLLDEAYASVIIEYGQMRDRLNRALNQLGSRHYSDKKNMV